MKTRWEPRRAERGASGVVVAIALVAVGGFLALGLNVGHIMKVRGQLQNATDAGALAGAKDLDGTAAGTVSARDFAHRFTELHATDLVPIGIDPNVGNDPDGDVVLGHWNRTQPKESAFTVVPYPDVTPGNVNAVLVRAGRQETRGNPLEVFFSAFLATKTASVGAEAVAVQGGPCEDCAAPLVFADCLLLSSDGTLSCGKTFVFSSATDDNIGFTNLIAASAVNPPTVIDILNGKCGYSMEGDQVGVSNGNNLTPAVIAAFRAYIDRYGPTIKAPVVSSLSCPNPQFNQLQTVKSFATFTITEIVGAPHPYLKMTLDCHSIPEPYPGGCEFFGTAAEPRLAR